MFSILLALAFFAYAVRRTLALLFVLQQEDYKTKSFLKALACHKLLQDNKILMPLIVVSVLAGKLPWIVWLAPALLAFGAVMEKEPKLVLDARANKILAIALAFNFIFVFKYPALLAIPMFVLVLPLVLIIAGWISAPIFMRKKKNAVRK